MSLVFMSSSQCCRGRSPILPLFLLVRTLVGAPRRGKADKRLKLSHCVPPWPGAGMAGLRVRALPLWRLGLNNAPSSRELRDDQKAMRDAAQERRAGNAVQDTS